MTQTVAIMCSIPNTTIGDSRSGSLQAMQVQAIKKLLWGIQAVPTWEGQPRFSALARSKDMMRQIHLVLRHESLEFATEAHTILNNHSDRLATHP